MSPQKAKQCMSADACITLQNILLTTKLHFANITAKGPAFVVWWPRFKEGLINKVDMVCLSPVGYGV